MAPKRRKAYKRKKDVRFGYEDVYRFEEELKRGKASRLNLEPTMKKKGKKKKVQTVDEEVDLSMYQVPDTTRRDKVTEVMQEISNTKREEGESMRDYQQRLKELSMSLGSKITVKEAKKARVFRSEEEEKKWVARQRQKKERREEIVQEREAKAYVHPKELAEDHVQFGEVAHAPPVLKPPVRKVVEGNEVQRLVRERYKQMKRRQRKV